MYYLINILFILIVYVYLLKYKLNSYYILFFYIFVIFTLFFIFIQSYRLTFNGILNLFTIIYLLLLIFFFFIGLYLYLYNKIWIINVGKLYSLSNKYSIQLMFIFDFISIFFSFLITFITFIVFFFTKNYFKNEAEISKFTSLIVSFSISMIFLILSSNLLFFFFWWEMIGLTSFFLINFYYIKKNVYKSAFKAFFFNKLSDNFILIGVILFIQDGVEMLHIIPGSLKLYNIEFTPIFFFFLGASVKSSQIGFHFWLPDSMEAPVPASALIHSATLVSAGVYILIRLNSYIIFFNYFYTFIYIWYSITALYGGLVASFQIDIKKLLAYSTISHCGFLFITTLNGIMIHTLVYLLLHGLFKAITFMIAGRIIQQLESQDLRCMSQLYTLLPLETLILIFSIINLSALPATLGLYYKVLLLTTLINSKITYLILFINFFGCLTGVSYTMHVLKAFFGKNLKYKKFFFVKTKKIPTIYTVILSIVLFLFIIIIYLYYFYYFNDSSYVELIKSTNHSFIFKLFYSLLIIYIFIVINFDTYKNKNYIFIYYICILITTFLI